MSRRHKGNYREKHPADAQIDPAILDALSADMPDGEVPCKRAFTLAHRLAVNPSEIGMAVDLQQRRLTACQLGLFGYDKGQSPLTKSDHVDAGLKSAIDAVVTQGKISCEQAWKIAHDRGIPKLEVARACESLSIRVGQCQLGAF